MERKPAEGAGGQEGSGVHTTVLEYLLGMGLLVGTWQGGVPGLWTVGVSVLALPVSSGLGHLGPF